MVACKRSYPLIALSLIVLSGGTASGQAERETSGEGNPVKGFRVERIEQTRTEEISWLRVQVVADTDINDTWAVLQDVKTWDPDPVPIRRLPSLARTGLRFRHLDGEAARTTPDALEVGQG